MILITALFTPLISSFICGILNLKLTNKQSSIIAVTGILITMLCSLINFCNILIGFEITHIVLIEWLTIGALKTNWSIYADQLASIMFVIVSIVSCLVHIYSVSYMEHDENLPRFMSYLSLFTFFMLLLVCADNFLQLFCGWEGVGLSSYLLIGFWYKKDSACNASIKAFLVNRIADLAIIIAIGLIFISINSIEFKEVFSRVSEINLISIKIFNCYISLTEIICFLIFIGCMGKSAQLGLHVWLPDAMEGPTPVSALIHAATMVTAGVFMIARCSFIFEYAPMTLNIIMVIGALTCIFAAIIAFTQNDIKRVIAYSTCSQLGYMFLACGVSAYNAAIFHLFTHAFYKALLFLGAGSIIHAVNDEQNIQNMGGLRLKLPMTYAMFWIGSLAIAGIYPLAGYYSKDLILESVYTSNANLSLFAFVLGILAAFFTALYSWRLIFLVFHGTTRLSPNIYKNAHEPSILMMAPISILSICAIAAGIVGVYILNLDSDAGFLSHAIYKISTLHHNHHAPIYIVLLPMCISILGIMVAYVLYIKTDILNSIIKYIQPLYLLVANKFYIDELYKKTFVIAYQLSTIICNLIDTKIVDRGGPNGISYLVRKIAGKLSAVHSGYIYSYALCFFIGLVIPFSYYVNFLI